MGKAPIAGGRSGLGRGTYTGGSVMPKESTQPFNINENTGEPSHRPEHDKARDDAHDDCDPSENESEESGSAARGE